MEQGDLYVNECQKIRHYHARSTEEKRMPSPDFFNSARCVSKLRNYSNVIHSFDCKSAIEHDDGV